VERLLAQAKKAAEAAEVFTVSAEETTAQFEANRLKHIQSKQSTHLALRIIKGGRLGYATTTDPGDVENLIKSAAETAQFGMLAGFEFPSQTTYPQTDTLDPAVEATPIEKMSKLGQELIEMITRHTPDILCEAMVSRDTVSVKLLNSRGGQAEYQKSVFGIGIYGSLIRGTDMLFVGESQSSGHPLTQPQDIAEVVIRQLELASALVPSLMLAFNGKTVLQGASPIGNKLGKKVFDDKISLWDDPTLAFRPNSRPCDDEGVASQRTPLIEGGVVAHFLYDLQTAALAKTKSTGSGDRSGGLPAPSASSLVIAPGQTSLDDMIKDIEEGLVIEQLMGAEQGNILGGDFSGNVLLGYKIESGKIVGRVKNTMVSGNVYQVLREVTAVGSRAEWVGGFLHTPPLYCPRLSVASKG
jgi:PmbA protein